MSNPYIFSPLSNKESDSNLTSEEVICSLFERGENI
jgi:hypothetical protein